MWHMKSHPSFGFSYKFYLPCLIVDDLTLLAFKFLSVMPYLASLCETELGMRTDYPEPLFINKGRVLVSCSF